MLKVKQLESQKMKLFHDFSHEIPQQIFRFPPLGAIFLSALPPHLT
jgi:hypothetical protein